MPVCWKNNADVSEMNAHGHRNGRTYSKTNKKSPVVWLLVPEGSEAQLRSDSWQMHGRLVAKLNNWNYAAKLLFGLVTGTLLSSSHLPLCTRRVCMGYNAPRKRRDFYTIARPAGDTSTRYPFGSSMQTPQVGFTAHHSWPNRDGGVHTRRVKFSMRQYECHVRGY